MCILLHCHSLMHLPSSTLLNLNPSTVVAYPELFTFSATGVPRTIMTHTKSLSTTTSTTDQQKSTSTKLTSLKPVPSIPTNDGRVSTRSYIGTIPTPARPTSDPKTPSSLNSTRTQTDSTSVHFPSRYSTASTVQATSLMTRHDSVTIVTSSSSSPSSSLTTSKNTDTSDDISTESEHSGDTNSEKESLFGE